MPACQVGNGDSNSPECSRWAVSDNGQHGAFAKHGRGFDSLTVHHGIKRKIFKTMGK